MSKIFLFLCNKETEKTEHDKQDAAAPRAHSSDVDGRGAVIACVVKILCLFWGSQQEVRPF